ncbi:hypothetical protein [Burkholderia multivorans]|uniref:hypothetical protein n=1 Tax=Burkholderia multivorans TaxID=87883 RepID=UPI0011B1D5E3|nr:hypothetical protein [Burkholderia multivorans]
MDIHSINLAALIASIASFGFSTMARKSSIYLNLGWVAFALTGSLYVCSGWKAWGGSGWIDESDPEALYPPGKNGRKRIGEETAELLSEKFPGWLSEEGWKGSGSSSTSAAPVASQIASPRGWNRLRDDQRAAIEHLIDVMLTRTPSSDVNPPTDGFARD